MTAEAVVWIHFLMGRFWPEKKTARWSSGSVMVHPQYYAGLGPIHNILPFTDQQHNIYAVTDFKIGRWEVNAGIGYGLTQASDRWMAKMIIGTELNEGTPEKSSSGPKLMRRSAAAMGSLPRNAVSMSEALLPEGF
jgi:hypothetical protein